MNMRTTRWWVGCCLLVALPLFGLSGLVSAILGPVHYHASAVPAATDLGPMAGWRDFRRTEHVADSTFHVHDHSKLGRHHHDATDASLIVVGATEHDDGAEGTASGATSIVVLAATTDEVSVVVRPQLAADVKWMIPAACTFHSCDSRRLERPPSLSHSDRASAQTTARPDAGSSWMV